MNYKYWLVLGGLSLSVGWLISDMTISRSNPHSTITKVERESSVENKPELSPILSLTNSDLQQEVMDKNVEVLASIDAPNKPSTYRVPPLGHVSIKLWKNIEQTPAQYTKLESHNIDRRFVEYNNNAFVGLALGDSFEIALPQLNTEYTPKVMAVEVHANGDRTLSGRYLGDDDKAYSITVTQSSSAMFATIATPSDVYFMQGQQSQGWLISGKDQDSLKTWIDEDSVAIPNDAKLNPPPIQ
ncbi:hypothetical protein [Agarivorans sp. DSG3-1]|uniref:hypothetical protein n=1 Tax=Agarivorans sp. DSG3-1 TaxID=3342249 RepID=UPI00398EA702